MTGKKMICPKRGICKHKVLWDMPVWEGKKLIGSQLVE